LTQGFASVFYEAIARPIDGRVPEPSTFALIGSALLGMGWLTRRRQQRSNCDASVG
jgi:hypothetical protein